MWSPKRHSLSQRKKLRSRKAPVFLCVRQLDGESCAFARNAVAVYIDRPAVRLDELFCDCQPQSAVDSLTARFVSAPEAVKDERQVFERDARACVLNGNLQFVIRVLCFILDGFDMDRNRPATGGMAQRIGNQVGENLVYPIVVGCEFLIRVREVCLEVDTQGSRLGGKT